MTDQAPKEKYLQQSVNEALAAIEERICQRYALQFGAPGSYALSLTTVKAIREAIAADVRTWLFNKEAP